MLESQKNITTLTKQYKELSDISGLPTQMDRLRVSGYRRTKALGSSTQNIVADLPQDATQQQKFDFNEYKEYLSQNDIYVSDNINTLDKELVERNLIHLDKLHEQYNVTDRQRLILDTNANKKI